MDKNNDFKFVLQDSSNIYFGKELSYAEIMEHEDVPFKFKAIISNYVKKDLLQESAMEEKLAMHLLELAEDAFSMKVYEQLKLKVRIFYKEEKKNIWGQTKDKWIHKTCTLHEYRNEYKEKVMRQEVGVEDVSISKLALMVISI